ncbi:MAG: hypothetical protein JO140_01240 [Candidatus Eremiobacteraeota bacterium]|nr:hypothetical protein [Candidatus Eremiobacteraeota bacterium]
MLSQEALLVAAVAVVGVLHTIVPDHWAPIAFVARQEGWTKQTTVRVALGAGTGHVVSTLAIGALVWVAGAVVAAKFGHYLSIASSLALIGFGLWIAVTSWYEVREHLPFALATEPVGGRHMHLHRHGAGLPHAHLHAHDAATWHPAGAELETDPPLHGHEHKRSGRTTLLFILGSSPMIEGLPAFFAAGKYGPGLIVLMSVVFAFSTIATYVVLCVSSASGLQALRFGKVEEYGEVLSGAFIALVGLVFLIWPQI